MTKKHDYNHQEFKVCVPCLTCPGKKIRIVLNLTSGILAILSTIPFKL
jgi:hypothetical protein